MSKKSRNKDDKIEVIPPRINVDIKNFYQASSQSLSTFFYPAGGASYKNHKIIVDACKILKQKNKNEFQGDFYIKRR